MNYPHLSFQRGWNVSDLAQNLLGQCEAYAVTLTHMPLRPELHDLLLAVALQKGAQATTAIEGNTLSEEEVARVADGENLPASKEYQEREVRNVLDAMNELLNEVADRDEVTLVSEELLKRLHYSIGKELGEHFDAIPGRFREDARVVGNIYRCPDHVDVPGLVEKLCGWLRSEFHFETGKQSLSEAIVQAIVAHVYLEWIHPFGDGNGRTGRLVEFYILLRAGLPDIACHILSNHYNLTRSEYYRQIRSAHDQRDLSEFIEYAVQGLRDGLYETLGKVQSTLFATAWRSYIYDRFAPVKMRKRVVFKRRRDLALAMPIDRAATAEEVAFSSPDLSRAYATLTPTTLARDFQHLQELGLAVRTSEGEYQANTAAIRMPRRRRINGR